MQPISLELVENVWLITVESVLSVLRQRLKYNF
jgi:hypothetical protein